jgi:hypothetical protein
MWKLPIVNLFEIRNRALTLVIVRKPSR